MSLEWALDLLIDGPFQRFFIEGFALNDSEEKKMSLVNLTELLISRFFPNCHAHVIDQGGDVIVWFEMQSNVLFIFHSL